MISHYKFDELGKHDYGWLKARYHFNFANYYNPDLKSKNPLVVWNDDTIKSQTGFPMHSHQNMEIITYIRKGSITHKDSFGNLVTTISFSIPELKLITIKVFDIGGNEIKILLNEVLNVGNYSIIWNASDETSGVYLIRMISGEFTYTQKVVLIK